MKSGPSRVAPVSATSTLLPSIAEAASKLMQCSHGRRHRPLSVNPLKRYHVSLGRSTYRSAFGANLTSSDVCCSVANWGTPDMVRTAHFGRE